jgi:hypothetical protein
MLKIGGADLPTPAEYQVGVMDIDQASGRAASGMMVRKRIAVKRKIELTWRALTEDQLSALLNLVSPVFFEVQYVDPVTGGTKSGMFYAGDRSCGALKYTNGLIVWKDIKFNLVER